MPVRQLIILIITYRLESLLQTLDTFGPPTTGFVSPSPLSIDLTQLKPLASLPCSPASHNLPGRSCVKFLACVKPLFGNFYSKPPDWDPFEHIDGSLKHRQVTRTRLCVRLQITLPRWKCRVRCHTQRRTLRSLRRPSTSRGMIALERRSWITP